MKHGDLDRYREMREFSGTSEPRGRAPRRRSKGLRYVIQKHAARQLHYDFRLELDGVLRSWAVPKGPSEEPGDKRLAVEVEDHPLEYGRFKGEIPKGHYGAGTVEIWDDGVWTPEGDPHDGLARGRLTFRLEGRRLKGVWSLIRLRSDGNGRKPQWLLIRSRRDLRSTSPIAETPPKVEAADFVQPELATLVDEVPEGNDWIHELKFDGYRILADVNGRKVRLLTRTGLDWTARFEATAKALGALRLKNALLDGEIVALDDQGVSNFATLQKALSDENSGVLLYQVFDLLRLQGRDLRERPLLERKQALAKILPPGSSTGAVRYTDHVLGSGEAFQREACRRGLEGIVCKRVDAPYRPGRTSDWVKVKCVKEQEFVIGGFTDPQGQREEFGALLLGYHEGGKLTYAGRVGTGFDSPRLHELGSKLDRLRRSTSPFQEGPTRAERRGVHWVEPRLVAQIRFAGWTDDHRLRIPVFLGLREDKPAAEVGLEIAQPVARSSDAVAGVPISNPDRVLFPEQRLTKIDLARYYERVAERMLPYVADRPLSLLRCPDGRAGPCFYQKNWSGESGPVRTIRVPGKSGSTSPPVVDDVAGLVTLIQHGTIEIHPWGARARSIERPELCVFDLDPSPGIAWPDLVDAARSLRHRLQALDLESFLKTTGGKGLHLVIPLTGRAGWDELREFARSIATGMAGDHPDRYTATMSKQVRKGLIFIDWLRNGRGATAVAPYSTRARANAPVATPMNWDELDQIDRADAFSVGTIGSRLETAPDPWKGYDRVRQSLPRRSSTR